MNTDLMFSSATDMWATPQSFFDQLNDRFCFTVDVCAVPENAKCSTFFTPEQDGLAQDWKGVCWMNPPYGRTIGEWVEKAYTSAVVQRSCTVVALLPARTDTKWFHNYIYQQPSVELIFLKGRLKFGDGKNSAPFPSMLAIFSSLEGRIEMLLEQQKELMDAAGKAARWIFTETGGDYEDTPWRELVNAIAKIKKV